MKLKDLVLLCLFFHKLNSFCQFGNQLIANDDNTFRIKDLELSTVENLGKTTRLEENKKYKVYCYSFVQLIKNSLQNYFYNNQVFGCVGDQLVWIKDDSTHPVFDGTIQCVKISDLTDICSVGTYHNGRITYQDNGFGNVLAVSHGGDIEMTDSVTGTKLIYTCENYILRYKLSGEECLMSEGFEAKISYGKPDPGNDRWRTGVCRHKKLFNVNGRFFKVLRFKCRDLQAQTDFLSTTIPLESLECVAPPSIQIADLIYDNVIAKGDNNNYLTLYPETGVISYSLKNKKLSAVCEHTHIRVNVHIEDGKFFFTELGKQVTSVSTTDVCQSCSIHNYPTEKTFVLHGSSEILQSPPGKMLVIQGAGGASEYYSRLKLNCRYQTLTYTRTDGSTAVAPKVITLTNIPPRKCDGIDVMSVENLVQSSITIPILDWGDSFSLPCTYNSVNAELACTKENTQNSNVGWHKRVMEICPHCGKSLELSDDVEVNLIDNKLMLSCVNSLESLLIEGLIMKNKELICANNILHPTTYSCVDPSKSCSARFLSSLDKTLAGMRIPHQQTYRIPCANPGGFVESSCYNAKLSLNVAIEFEESTNGKFYCHKPGTINHL